MTEFQKLAEITWVCDPDKGRLNNFEKATGAKSTNDLRKVLDDKELQAVVISTPDHWHAPAAIMACNAGKHVYVEKPCSHNFAEGAALVHAARQNNVVVQHGTQSRSNRLIVDAIQLIKEGAIGDVLMAKAWNIQRRNNIGKSKPSVVPENVDYDSWIGPAQFMPYQSNRFHYSWHWWHNFGTGDIGNDGAHEMDIARWGLGVEGFPSSASAIGGKYYFDDDQEFPDHATCVFEWPGDGQVGHRRQLMFEMRIWSKNYPYNCDCGVEFYGTRGMLMVSKRGKLMLWSEDNKPVEAPKPKEIVPLPSSHQADFLSAIQTGRKPSQISKSAINRQPSSTWQTSPCAPASRFSSMPRVKRSPMTKPPINCCAERIETKATGQYPRYRDKHRVHRLAIWRRWLPSQVALSQ